MYKLVLETHAGDHTKYVKSYFESNAPACIAQPLEAFQAALTHKAGFSQVLQLQPSKESIQLNDIRQEQHDRGKQVLLVV